MVYTRKTEDVFDLMYDYGYGDASEKYNVAYEMFQRAHSALMDFEDHEF